MAGQRGAMAKLRGAEGTSGSPVSGLVIGPIAATIFLCILLPNIAAPIEPPAIRLAMASACAFRVPPFDGISRPTHSPHLYMLARHPALGNGSGNVGGVARAPVPQQAFFGISGPTQLAL